MVRLQADLLLIYFIDSVKTRTAKVVGEVFSIAQKCLALFGLLAQWVERHACKVKVLCLSHRETAKSCNSQR